MLKRLLPLIFICIAQLAIAQSAVDLTGLANIGHTERSIRLKPLYGNELSNLDSAALFHIIARLEVLAESAHDPDLKWEAKLMRYHYYFHSAVGDRQGFEGLKNIEKPDGPKWFQAYFENMLGYFYWSRLQEYELGLYHLTRAADLLKDENGKEYPYRQKFQYQVGTHLCDLSDYENAIGYLREALSSPSPREIGFDCRIHASNSLGFAFRKLNRLDSSDHYFQRAYDLSKEQNSADWEGVAAGNIGENLYIRKRYDEAVPFLQKDISRCLIAKDWSSASNALTILGDIRLMQGDLQRARQLIDSAYQFSHRSQQIKRLAVVYPRLAKLFAAEGNIKLAQLYIDSSLIVNDSLSRESNQFRSTRAQQKVRLEEMRLKSKEEEFRFSEKLRQRNNSMLVVFLLALLLILILNQRRLKAKLGQRIADEKRIEAEQGLENAQQRLSDFVEHIQELQQEIVQRSLPETSEFSSSKTEVNELENSVILTARQWREFTDLFESVHPGFFERLNESLPDISAAETRFMALSRMRLSTKEMANMLAISTDAVRQTRSRLKRKLKLEVSLEQFALEV